MMAATYEELMTKARQLQADGRVEDAKRVAQIAVSMRDSTPAVSPIDTSMGAQVGSGVNEGLARTFGTPVDLMTSGINLLGSGIGKVTGLDVPQITDPIGGSKSIEGLLSPFISDVPPQTTGQRIGRRIGEEVGAGVPLITAAPAAMAKAPSYIGELGSQAISAFPKMAGLDVLSDVGAGAGAAIAQEVAPDSATAEIVASLVGGLGTAAGAGSIADKLATRGATKRAISETPDVDALKAQAGSLYDEA